MKREIFPLQTVHISSESGKQQPCLNETCIHIASTILESMDASIDPCEDFYSYACNGWIKKNPIPDGKTSWSTFLKLEQKNQLVIKHVLGKDSKSYFLIRKFKFLFYTQINQSTLSNPKRSRKQNYITNLVWT